VGIVSRSTGGGSGSGALLFDSTLGANAASIDTGANGIAQTQNVLEIWAVIRTDGAGATDTVTITLNNDSTAIYDRERLQGNNVTASAAVANAQAGWAMDVHGNGGGASYASYWCLTIPSYTQTTFFKAASLVVQIPDQTAGNNFAELVALGYRSTAAISRLKIAAVGNLLAGSRLLILGR
jgi:hypothetical protein